MNDTGNWTWTGARVLWAEVPVDRAAALQVLPPGMRLHEPGAATVFVADYPATAFGSVYREAAVLLHCSDERGDYLHCPWMAVDDDTALILGREMLGFPKKLAEFRFEVDGARALGTATRRGTELIRIEATLEESDPEPPRLFDRRYVNLFGSVVGGMSLLELPPAGESVHECRKGPGKVVLSSSDRDPLGLLATPSEAAVRYSVLDFAEAGGAAMPTIVGPVDDEAWAAQRFFARIM